MKIVLLSLLIPALSVSLVFAQAAAPQDTTEKAVAPEATEQVEEVSEAPAVESPLSIESMMFCTGVEEREPVGEASEFTTDIGKIFFWSNVMNEGDETTVEHVWYLNGEEKARVQLPVRYPRNRIWSSKIIPAEWDGQWVVEIVSADGVKLGEKTCTVR
jgi:hypothetical protein